ncbi:MAG: DNA polymerase III subunit gamma/tau, partial [Firmicutes bacterium]|nr:DNA polymerase III subunit gamma/tau [Bacillota bacterium]
MGYIALYREWRPQRFAEVVGQEHVSRTLLHAIQQGRVAHAYLFTGPRGTGKTSVAKILAKAVNCPEGQGGEPCNRCSNCREITAGSHVDVLEIDAASNRGIDEIRDLRERVRYAPASARFKVYIIDEVHMLTTEAFNALLKTLEEPPAHAIFVLATTEPHKVPATIISRCQVFEFRRLTEGQIAQRLTEVAKAGGAQVEAGVIELLAREAEGGLRDALSLFDQCLAFGGQELSLSEVALVLGKASDSLLEEMLAALAERDLLTALRLVQRVVEEGKDVRLFTRDLMARARELLLTGIAGGSPPHRQPVLPMGDLLELLEVLSQSETEMKWSSRPRLLLETSLIRWGMGRRPQATASQGEGLVQAEGTPGPDLGATPGGDRPDIIPLAERGNVPGSGELAEKRGTLLPHDGKDPKAQVRLAGLTPERPETKPVYAGKAPRSVPPKEGAAAGGTAIGEPAEGGVIAGKAKVPEAAPDIDLTARGESVPGQTGDTGSESHPGLAILQERWPEFLEKIKKARPSLYALLREGQLYGMEGNNLKLLFKFAAHRDILAKSENRQLVEKVLREMIGLDYRVTGFITEEIN